MQPSSEDPIVQEIPWVIMGMTIPVQISASGKIFVDGSPVLQPADKQPLGRSGNPPQDLPPNLRPR